MSPSSIAFSSEAAGPPLDEIFCTYSCFIASTSVTTGAAQVEPRETAKCILRCTIKCTLRYIPLKWNLGRPLNVSLGAPSNVPSGVYPLIALSSGLSTRRKINHFLYNIVHFQVLPKVKS